MARNRVQELGKHGWIEITGLLLDHPQPEVDVAKKATLVRLAERRTRTELPDPADVVQECGREDDVVSKPWMQLCRLTAERRDADRVLEEAPGISVVSFRRGSGK